MGRPSTILGRPDPCSRDAASGGQIARGDFTKPSAAARSTDALLPKWSGRDRPASQPQGGHPQKPIGQGLPVFAAEIWQAKSGPPWPCLSALSVGFAPARGSVRTHARSARPSGGAGGRDP